ncbi:MAG: MFS transporter [Syntrophobacteraceae bacterium]|nr:MFS transporter [Syntrophobacteraceae bacterium]
MSAQIETKLGKDTRMAMMSQFLGFMLDAYDMALVLIMAPILVKVFTSPHGSAAWQYITIIFTYSITMAARPVGSAIFGHYADKIGRRALLVFTIGGVGLISLLSAFMPTQAMCGVWAYVIFCVLRFVMGVFFGGEYAVGHTFAIEHSPSKRRGLVGGFIQSGFPLGYVFASVVFALISHFVSNGAMVQYGWRLAFMSGIMPVILALYIRKSLPESPEYKKNKAMGKIEKAPFFSMFKPPALWDFLQVFAFMTGLFLTDYSVYGFLPNILTLGGRGFDTTTYSLIYGFALFMAFLGYIFYGWLSDFWGRKRLTMNYCVFLVLFGVPSFYVLYHAAISRNVGLAVVGAIMAAMLKLAWGVVPAYLAERFPTRRRAVGVGFGYSSGALLGAWFSVYVWWAHRIPAIAAIEKQDMWLSPAVVLTIGAAITFASLLFSPETRKIELSSVGVATEGSPVVEVAISR